MLRHNQQFNKMKLAAKNFKINSIFSEWNVPKNVNIEYLIKCKNTLTWSLPMKMKVDKLSL